VTLSKAPLYEDVSEGPDDAAAYWMACADGVRIRVAVWGADVGTRGTVLLFPGRTEYIEKYGRTAAEFAARGYATLVIDWRGQGLSDRLLEDTALGHVHFLWRESLNCLSPTPCLPIPWEAALGCAPLLTGCL